MAVAIKCLLSEEGVEVEEYVGESSRSLQKGEDNTRSAEEARTKGANVMSAACSVCQRVFTLIKTRLV